MPHENASARSPGEVAAVGGELILVRAVRAEVRGGRTRETSDVIVLNLAVAPDLVAANKARSAPQEGNLTEKGVMEAVPHNEHHQVAFATDGKRTVSAPDTIRKSANTSTLAALLLLSL